MAMKNSNEIKGIIILFITFLFVQPFLFGQVNESDEFIKAYTIKGTQQRIRALQDFLKNYPNGYNSSKARYSIFETYVELKDGENAIKAADDLINKSSVAMQPDLYNQVAYLLAEGKLELQRAEYYIDKAIESAEGGDSITVRMYKDTKALIMFNLGYPDSALSLEKDAIVGSENDEDMLKSLSVYEEASGQRNEALASAAKSVLYGNTGESIDNFNKWIKEYKPNKEERNILRNKITNEVLKGYIKNSGKDNSTNIYSSAAVFLARMQVYLPKAEKWASSAVKSINRKTSLDDIITFKTNLAIVYSESNKIKASLRELTSVENFVDLLNSDYWYTLGSVYEKLHQNNDALDSYISGLVVTKSTKILKAVKTLLKKENKEDDQIDMEIDKKRRGLKDFEPGKFKGKKPTGRVVLGELFTGAECLPCACADLAFDKLSEYFPKDVFAILEYHLHFPGPDPLTNPQSIERYMYYGGEFGVPRVFFNGSNHFKYIAGGPEYIWSNRFRIWRYVIEKQLEEKPDVVIKGSAKLDDKKVIIKLNVSLRDGRNILKGKSLHIALAEKSVDYKGGNGIIKQAFVVRNLVDGADGSPLLIKHKTQYLKKTIDLENVDNILKKYLDDPSKGPKNSWWGEGKPNWRARPYKINPHNLAIIAWIQDNSTKEILQAYYTDINYDDSGSQ
jgi:hypothetical protein